MRYGPGRRDCAFRSSARTASRGVAVHLDKRASRTGLHRSPSARDLRNARVFAQGPCTGEGAHRPTGRRLPVDRDDLSAHIPVVAELRRRFPITHGRSEGPPPSPNPASSRTAARWSAASSGSSSISLRSMTYRVMASKAARLPSIPSRTLHCSTVGNPTKQATAHCMCGRGCRPAPPRALCGMRPPGDPPAPRSLVCVPAYRPRCGPCAAHPSPGRRHSRRRRGGGRPRRRLEPPRKAAQGIDPPPQRS